MLRLSDDPGADPEVDRIFKTLHERFVEAFPKSGQIVFDGFDTDGCFFWFYFRGPDGNSVRQAVLSQIDEDIIQSGSYFVSNATHYCADPMEGRTDPLA